MKYKCSITSCTHEPSVNYLGKWLCWKHWSLQCDKEDKGLGVLSEKDVVHNPKPSYSSAGESSNNTPNGVVSSASAGETQRRLR